MICWIQAVASNECKEWEKPKKWTDGAKESAEETKKKNAKWIFLNSFALEIFVESGCLAEQLMAVGLKGAIHCESIERH